MGTVILALVETTRQGGELVVKAWTKKKLWTLGKECLKILNG